MRSLHGRNPSVTLQSSTRGKQRGQSVRTSKYSKPCDYSWLLVGSSISIWVLTGDSVHSTWLYSDAPLGNQATGTMTWYPTQSHYSDTESDPVLVMPSIRLCSNKYWFFKLVWFDHCLNATTQQNGRRATQLIQASRLVIYGEKLKVLILLILSITFTWLIEI